MDPLLARQLRKHLPGIDPHDPHCQGFLQAVENAYRELREDRAFLEHTLETTSQELTEANEKLRRESESKLASLSRYYQQTLELQQGMIQCVRRTARGFEHTLCRGQLLQRLGRTAEEFEGHTVEEVVPPAQAAQINAAYERAWAGEEFSLTYRSTNGVELFVLLRPRLEHETVVEIIVSCVEITDLKEAERALIAAKERAEAADRAKGEFLAVMSHEMRTPLNAVLGFADLLLTTPLTPQQQTWLGTIGTSGESLLALINDILDYSKIEAGNFALHPESFPLAVLLDEVTSLFSGRAAEKNLRLILDAAPNLPAHVSVDRLRLRQILVNLVGNAIKFTAQGSVHIRAEATPDPATPGQGTLHFTITDTGIGIPADRVDRLFKPFSQVDSSATRQYGGAGLGLAISDRIVRMLGGRIGYARAEQGGSAFSFSVLAAFTAPVAVAVPAPETTAPTASTLRILVAEDHPLNRELIRILLESRGYHPVIVDNGHLALNSALSQPFDLVLMDLQMPGLDGLQATREILARLEPSRRPVIYALTANVFPEDRARCTAAGMQGLLTKPLNSRELFALLASLEPQESPILHARAELPGTLAASFLEK